MATILPAAPDDAATILEIQTRAFAEEGRLSESQDIPPLTETLAAVIDHIRSHRALVARQGDRIVGSVRGIVVGSVCTIRGLSVEPEHQGHGIGAALLRALEASLPAVSRFELTTSTIVEGNVRFYERYGYRTTELTRFSERVTLAQMRKAAGIESA